MTTLMLLLQASMDAVGAATLVATFVAPFVTHLTKNVLGVDSLKAYAVHLAVSAALVAGFTYAFGQFTMGGFAANFGIVATGAQTLFKVFKAASGLSVSPSEPPSDNPPEG